jgi:hypothetical protein
MVVLFFFLTPLSPPVQEADRRHGRLRRRRHAQGQLPGVHPYTYLNIWLATYS